MKKEEIFNKSFVGRVRDMAQQIYLNKNPSVYDPELYTTECYIEAVERCLLADGYTIKLEKDNILVFYERNEK